MHINIIGAGLAGLSAAVTLAQNGTTVCLISAQPSERAQSVLAEGGINGALNVMGEDDSPEQHAADTRKAGADIADPAAVDDLCRHAPEILAWFQELGVPFNQENGHIIQRNFGGQKKKRTAFAKSSTGRVLMRALTDACRQYEAQGLIRRYSHHGFEEILTESGAGGTVCRGVLVRDAYTGEILEFPGPVIICSGGLNGFFPGRTTGTTANTGDVTARLFLDGVRASSLEMIQYHPTTVGIAGKRCLVSEAARGEGGRLFILRDGKPYFFMEEQFPELGNLMPRDVISRQMVFAVRDSQPAPAVAAGRKPRRGGKGGLSYDGCRSGQVYLELRHLSEAVWKEKLPDLREELIHYLHLDPMREPVPVEPGIHYFMGGLDVDRQHRTNFRGLYAAGECTSQYHGANRLGGNSTLGAVYGGMTAAQTAAREAADCGPAETGPRPAEAFRGYEPADSGLTEELGGLLYEAMGIVRNQETIRQALRKMEQIQAGRTQNHAGQARLALARAMLLSCDARQESRGAHWREDFPEQDGRWTGMITAQADPVTGQIRIGFRPAGENHEDSV